MTNLECDEKYGLGYEITAEQRVFAVFHRGKVKELAEVMQESFDVGKKPAQAVLSSTSE